MVGLQDEDLGKVEHKNVCHQTDSVACLHSQVNDILRPLLNFIIFADKKKYLLSVNVQYLKEYSCFLDICYLPFSNGRET